MEVGVYRSRGSRYRERYRRYERRGAARVPAIGSLIAGILTRDGRRYLNYAFGSCVEMDVRIILKGEEQCKLSQDSSLRPLLR
jgi:hypothetical protein